ncbi:hypothetical protein [Asanoa siamensis]|uniref:hypothetical protein n=1 Tax=Asanoa siamensis TaxID=926357 RepID=UPI0019457429|nr:hypothetical protein [Asanoa siamensis]
MRSRSTRGSRSDTYPFQDPTGPEGRAWLCAPTTRGCRHFFTAVAATFQDRLVVGGDFNLGDLSTCLPAGYADDSDGGLQHVAVTGPGGRLRLVDMAGTTDHPALAVTFVSR